VPVELQAAPNILQRSAHEKICRLADAPGEVNVPAPARRSADKVPPSCKWAGHFSWPMKQRPGPISARLAHRTVCCALELRAACLVLQRPGQVGRRVASEKRVFSNVWKKDRQKFPMFGKNGLIFSKHWKVFCLFFQGLEKIRPDFDRRVSRVEQAGL